MQIRQVMLGAVIALSALLPMGNAQALPAGWSGACYGGDYYTWDGNGNYAIFHGSWRCE